MHSMVLSNRVILFEVLSQMKMVSGSGGGLVPISRRLELRAVGKICRETGPQWKDTHSSHRNCLPKDGSKGSASVGGRDLLSGDVQESL